jgi:Electron transfer DM13
MRNEIKFGIIGAIIIIIGISAFYVASPLFISTEINEPLPEGAEISPPTPSNQFQEFVAMSEEERIDAGNQMDEQEKNQIMLEFAKLNTSINESMAQINNQSLSEQQTSQTGNETSNLLLTGSFIGVEDGIHDAQGIAKVIPIEGGGDVLRLEDLVVTNGPDLYVYLSTDKSASDFVNIGRLKANIGNQNYPIPDGTDMTKYDTVLIWCRAFSVLFGSAELTPPAASA